MALEPADIIEVIVDELVTSDIGQAFGAISVSRTGPGSLLLDYGDGGRFRLEVVEIHD
jgi:hypothetical protein